ncbi:MAG TPA: DUF1223 domain-containing protein [Rhizomicrobium sp.]|jgi:hypothetical protein|nr:DUF1223 domain-containing protein [Rhizomicrobium sp.]
MEHSYAIGAVFLGGLALASGSVQAAPQPPLTVVELFQSQGCSDCPPANANVMALSDRPDLLTLSFGVTYWDQLGWKDTFASPQYTARQWDYARALHHSEVYTPQVIVNGGADITGRNKAELESLIRRETNLIAPPLGIDASKVHVGEDVTVRMTNAKGVHYDVWLVRFDPRIENVPIARGENGGLTLPHKNVVKQLVKLGVWSGTAVDFPLPAATQAGLKDAVLVQKGPGGAIVAAAR